MAVGFPWTALHFDSPSLGSCGRGSSVLDFRRGEERREPRKVLSISTNADRVGTEGWRTQRQHNDSVLVSGSECWNTVVYTDYFNFYCKLMKCTYHSCPEMPFPKVTLNPLHLVYICLLQNWPPQTLISHSISVLWTAIVDVIWSLKWVSCGSYFPTYISSFSSH
jgi:hypothetical protein